MFAGSHIAASERDQRTLVIEVIRAPEFASPHGTFALHLPIAGIVGVRVEPCAREGFASLLFTGDFAGFQPGLTVELAPIMAADAAPLARLLTRRYRLPKVPRIGVGRDARTSELVTLLATYAPSPHGADFGFVRLECDAALRETLVAGQSYHVTGFFHPARDVAGAMPSGFTGPWLRVFELAATHLAVPCPICDAVVEGPRLAETPSVVARSQLGPGECGCRARDLFSMRGEDELVVALLVGTGAQRAGDYVAQVAQQALAIVLDEPAYGSIPYHAELPPPDTSLLELAAWIPALVDRTPLPASPAALLVELARRVGAVVATLGERGGELSASGALVHVQGRTLTLDRRGGVRAYLVRDGQASCVVREHSVAEQLRAAGQPVPPPLLGAMLSWMGACEAAEPPIRIELVPGDRIVIVPWLVYDHCDERVLDRIVRTASDDHCTVVSIEARGNGG